jgi:pimeloyl-ACP methyl ester carboxylesterase
MRRFGTLTLAAGLAVVLLSGAAPNALASESAAGAMPAYSQDGNRDPGLDRVRGVGTVTWGACVDPTLVAFGAECGMLTVPLDYTNPRGTKVQLALSRVRHTVPDAQYQGVMLINPGGPGGSGLIFSIFATFVPNGAGGAYDWIGFDPRGVGASIPALSCIPDYSVGPRPAYEPTTRAIETAWLKRSNDYASACARNGRDLLNHIKTTDNVQDMNAIRSALGEKQINYYGFSYGTYLGQVFATMYPSKVRRMVLDANVDPRRVWYPANLDQDVAFEKVAHLFFDWIARHDSTYHLGTLEKTVEAAYYGAIDTLRATPRGTLGPAEWEDAFLLAGYVQSTWPDVASALAAFVNSDDPAPATALYESFDAPGNDNGTAMYLGTECTDARWPRNWSIWQRDNTRVAQQAPFLTWGNAWFNAPCAFWPAKSSQPVDVRGKKLPPFLLLSETLDAATPFSGSLEVRKLFSSASLIATEGGTTHANSLAGNACVDDRIAAYLQDGTTPTRLRGSGPDVVCQAMPEPEPTPAGLAATRRSATQLDTLRLAIASAGR